MPHEHYNMTSPVAAPSLVAVYLEVERRTVHLRKEGFSYSADSDSWAGKFWSISGEDSWEPASPIDVNNIALVANMQSPSWQGYAEKTGGEVVMFPWPLSRYLGPNEGVAWTPGVFQDPTKSEGMPLVLNDSTVWEETGQAGEPPRTTYTITRDSSRYRMRLKRPEAGSVPDYLRQAPVKVVLEVETADTWPLVLAEPGNPSTYRIPADVDDVPFAAPAEFIMTLNSGEEHSAWVENFGPSKAAWRLHKGWTLPGEFFTYDHLPETADPYGADGNRLLN